MEPFTYVRHALGAAPSSHIHFGSLEFINNNGPMPVSSFYSSQVLRLGGLEFVVDHLGQPYLSIGIMPPQWMSMLAFDFYPDQVPCLNDLDLVADHLGQLCLYEGTMPPS